jgi:hypothetical protein
MPIDARSSTRLAALAVSLALLLSCSLGHAEDCTEDYEYRPFTIKLPKNYKELPPRRMDNGMSFVFREDKPENETAAVLQFVFYDEGEDLRDAKGEKLEEAKLQYLDRFLKGIERRRDNFTKSQVKDRTIGELGYKKVEWTGKAYGSDMAGVMYSTIIGATVVSISAQDSAARAGESVKQLEWCLDTLELTGTR